MCLNQLNPMQNRLELSKTWLNEAKSAKKWLNQTRKPLS